MPLHVCPTVAYLCRLISSSSLTVLRDYHTLFHNGCAFYVPISNVSPPPPASSASFSNFYPVGNSHSDWGDTVSLGHLDLYFLGDW